MNREAFSARLLACSYPADMRVLSCRRISSRHFLSGILRVFVSFKKDSKMPIDINRSIKGAASLNTYPVGAMLFVVRSGILKRFLPIAILDTPATINQDIKALTLYLPSIAVGLAYFIKAFEPYILEELTKSVTTVDSLRFDEFKDMLIPVPPEAEWNRIVAQLNTALGDVITNQ